MCQNRLAYNLHFRVTTTDSHVNTFMAALEEIVSEKNPSLIVCAFASGCQKLYTAIKRKLCVELASKIIARVQNTRRRLIVNEKFSFSSVSDRADRDRRQGRHGHFYKICRRIQLQTRRRSVVRENHRRGNVPIES